MVLDMKKYHKQGGWEKCWLERANTECKVNRHIKLKSQETAV